MDCGEHGTLIPSTSDNSTWICSCLDNYSGRQCEYSEWETIKGIIIVIVCTLVPLLTIAALCCVLRCKRFTKLLFNTDTNISFKYQDMNRARKSTSRKLFQMQRQDENEDDDGFTPRRI